MLRGSDARQERVLSLIGAGLLVCIALAVFVVTAKPFSGQPADQLTVSIDTPYIGQGIEAGSAVVMHGVEVGRVSSVASLPGGGVRLVTDLQKAPTDGLTDTMGVDFRPINYFGVPGVNVIPNAGGEILRNGSAISLVPRGNFTLSELLSQLGGVSQGALSPQLITLVDRATRYTDGLTPLFETMKTVTTAVADVQEVPTAQLLANTAPISEVFPSFATVLIEAGTRFMRNDYYPGHVATTSPAASGPTQEPPYLEDVLAPSLQDESDEMWNEHYVPFFRAASDGLFGAIGKLETTHVDDLLPLVTGIKAITDPVPTLIRPEKFAQTMVELRTRFEKLYAGNGQQRALQVRVVLDSLPGVAAPLGVAIDGASPDVPATADAAGTMSAEAVSPGDVGSPG